MPRWAAVLDGDPCRRCGWPWPDAAESTGFVETVAAEFTRVLEGADGSARHPDLGRSATEIVADVADDLRRGVELVTGFVAERTEQAEQAERDDPDVLRTLRRNASDWVEVIRGALDDATVQDLARTVAHDVHHHLRDVRRTVAFQRRPHPRALVVGGEGLRLSTSADTELLTGWLADPRVHRWWGGRPVSSAEVRRKYTGAREPDVVVYLVLVADRPVGLLEAWHEPDGRAGLDMFLAPAAQGRGTGPRVARALAGELTRAGWGTLTVDPALDNPRAVGAWRRAGFAPTGERGGDEGHETVLMAFVP